MIYYTLDRIEDENFAVLVDDSGKPHDVSLSQLPNHDGVGSVFYNDNGEYIFDKSETEIRRKRIGQKRKKFFDKIKTTEGANN